MTVYSKFYLGETPNNSRPESDLSSCSSQISPIYSAKPSRCGSEDKLDQLSRSLFALISGGELGPLHEKEKTRACASLASETSEPHFSDLREEDYSRERFKDYDPQTFNDVFEDESSASRIERLKVDFAAQKIIFFGFKGLVFKKEDVVQTCRKTQLFSHIGEVVESTCPLTGNLFSSVDVTFRTTNRMFEKLARRLELNLESGPVENFDESHHLALKGDLASNVQTIEIVSRLTN